MLKEKKVYLQHMSAEVAISSPRQLLRVAEMSVKQIYYSEKYYDDIFEYR